MAGKFKGKEAVGVGYLKEITEGYYILKAQVSTIEVKIALRDSDIPLEELKEKAPVHRLHLGKIMEDKKITNRRKKS